MVMSATRRGVYGEAHRVLPRRDPLIASRAVEILDRLAAHRTLSKVPREQLAWLAERGRILTLAVGETIYEAGDPIDELWVVLSGRFHIRIQRETGWRRVAEWGPGDVAGLLPFSRMRASPGESHVEEPLELFGVHKRHFPEMIRDCQELTATLVHVMVDRARHFRQSDLHDDKLASLGRLAAGLAHELNNPASAAARSAGLLADRLPDAEAAFRALGAFGLGAAELAALDRLRDCCLSRAEDLSLSAVEQAERQEAIEAWLGRHGVPCEAAGALGETGLSLGALDDAARALRPEALAAGLVALAASCGTRRLAADIERAAGRVHELVAAVKGFTYMDQARTPKPVDLARGLSDTLTILRAKAKAESVRVTLEVEPGLPMVQGFGGELNQVWANLLDNAIDAAPAGGRVEISARRQGESVVVRFVDDGPGVPAELKDRMFEPFFTTKPVGQGTGLGLSISRSLVGQHDGEIEVDSRPGRTEFRVTLPAGERA
jgi:signal transduction histidine kinase